MWERLCVCVCVEKGLVGQPSAIFILFSIHPSPPYNLFIFFKKKGITVHLMYDIFLLFA